jgi:hypothetical protein
MKFYVLTNIWVVSCKRNRGSLQLLPPKVPERYSADVKKLLIFQIAVGFLFSSALMPLARGNDIQDAITKARQAQLDYEKRVNEIEAKAVSEKEKLDKAKARILSDRDVLKFCRNLADCRRGEIGPAGGFIFYVAAEPTEWGRYIEVIDTQRSAAWCDESRLPLFENASTLLQTKIGTRIGAGKTNTELIAAACAYGAAKIVAEFEYGGFDDWYLPSLYELNEICKFIRYQDVNREALCLNIGDIRPMFKAAYERSQNFFWSSSEDLRSEPPGGFAFGADFSAWYIGKGAVRDKKFSMSVLAIRYFGPKNCLLSSAGRTRILCESGLD